MALVLKLLSLLALLMLLFVLVFVAMVIGVVVVVVIVVARLLFVCGARRLLCGVCGSSCIVVRMLFDVYCSLLVVV